MSQPPASTWAHFTFCPQILSSMVATVASTSSRRLISSRFGSVPVSVQARFQFGSARTDSERSPRPVLAVPPRLTSARVAASRESSRTTPSALGFNRAPSNATPWWRARARAPRKCVSQMRWTQLPEGRLVFNFRSVSARLFDSEGPLLATVSRFLSLEWDKCVFGRIVGIIAKHRST